MKKLLFLGIISLFAFSASAQSVAINTDGSTADASAILDLKSTNQGVLVPRLTQSQRTMISAPATGLMVYQTDATAGFYFYNGTAWTSMNGTAGTNGTNGQGLLTGGTANQVLAKIDGTDYNTAWVTPATGGTSLPTQTGNTGKVLSTDGTNANWNSAPILGGMQVVTCTSGATTSFEITNTNVRTILLDFQASVPNTTNTIVNATLPSAGSYPVGTRIVFTSTNTVTTPQIQVAAFNLKSSGSTLTAHGSNSVSTASGLSVVNTADTKRFEFITDGINKWYRIH
jgi:predicted transcriptional regulator